MTIYFSPSLVEFFSDEYSTELPTDAVKISDEHHEWAWGKISQGEIFNGMSEDGLLTFTSPEESPRHVPQQVTRAQGKAALIQAGLWADVLAFVDGIEDPTEKAMAEVALHDTMHWQRTSPFLNAAATALGLTSQQLDDLFTAAWVIEL